MKWTGTRSEVFLADEQARDVLSHGELALDASGRILGMRFDMLANLGAYLAPTGPFINTIGIVNCISGVYDVPATYARIRLALTNTAPMAAYRGAGRPVMSYAIERLVEHAATRARHRPGRAAPQELHPDKPLSVPALPPASSTTAAISRGFCKRRSRPRTGTDFPEEKKQRKNVDDCSAAACPPTSRRPAPGSRRRTRSSCAGTLAK